MAQYVDDSLATAPQTVTSKSAYLTGYIFSNASGAARTINVSNGTGDGDIILEKIALAANSTETWGASMDSQKLSFPSGIYASGSAIGVNVVFTFE